VKPYVARSWLSIVPLRQGAGTRLKIVESLALGTPVVSTSKGAEGLAVTHGEDILVADDAESFAAAVVDVLRNADLRGRLSENGRRLASEKYSARAMAQSISTLIERVCAGGYAAAPEPRA
jgi:glycosyltransferase involved in cell wall biosynthesis